MTDNLMQIMREAIHKSKVISIHAAAGMCDKKIHCYDPNHDDRWCARCEATQNAANIIKQRILSLLDESQTEGGSR